MKEAAVEMDPQLELPMAPLEASPSWRGLPWTEKREKEKPRRCSHCGRPTNVYHRKLSTGMARKLLWLYLLEVKFPERREFHVGEFDQVGGRGEFGILSLFGLVEEAANLDPKKKTSGFWRLTDFGREFALAQALVPQYAIVRFRSEHLGFAGPMVSIRDCLEYRNRFNYQTLLNSPIM